MIFASGILLVLGILFFVSGVFLALKARSEGEETDIQKGIVGVGAGIGIVCCLVAGVLLFAVPQYRVWQQNKEGEAELARAEQNRQIAVQEAKAKEESAKSLANAEVIRAEGVAKANKIIGDSLQNNDAYIHYLWIEALRESSSDVIYIPTEAGIPITESARFYQRSNEQ